MFNYTATEELLNTIYDIYPEISLQIKTLNKNFEGNEYKSELIIADDIHNVGFEVLENEIIVFFFSAHTHFENYSDKNNSEYISHAKEFLKKLFTLTIKHEKIFKGKTLTEERYTFVNKDNTGDCPIYVCNKLLPRFIPFLSKHTYAKLYKYNSVQKTFTEMT